MADEITREDIFSKETLEFFEVLDNGWIGKALKSESDYKEDAMKLIEELDRLCDLEEIPNCYKQGGSIDYRVNRITGGFSLQYLDVLKKTKSNPDMTLQEYQDLIE